jgi:geranylgeranylglycerol-phosphate geranylgeranyltransferase
MAVYRVRGMVELTRPVNAIAAGGLTFVGAYVAGGAFAASATTGAAIGATILATAGGNTINDYFDREIDRINAPDRPIPRGAVTARTALGLSLLLFTIAVGLALTLPLLAIVIAAINLVLLVSYTTFFKGLPGAGNAVVAYLGGSTFLFGGAAVGNLWTPAVLFVLAALATFTREIVKDVEDMTGDEAEGLRTLPIAIGRRRAVGLGLALLFVAVAASPLPYVNGTFGLPYLLILVPADLLMLYAAYTGFADASRGQTLLKYGMFLAAAAFVVGRFTVG